MAAISSEANRVRSAVEMAQHCSVDDLMSMSNRQLKMVDPLLMNLLVAKSIPSLNDLKILPYLQKIDKWERDIRRGIASTRSQFHDAPQDWRHDINFFNLGYVAYYLDREIGIRYREDQRDVRTIRYTDPRDLFANGVMDSHAGTCASMAVLHVALGWRMRWPVSLACVWAHVICRYDDGRVAHNIEATKNGGGGFHSHPDDYYVATYKLPAVAVQCGSDLRALTPREMLGWFIGLRGRHYQDTGMNDQSEADFLLARSLFPNNRYLHFVQMMLSIQKAAELFHPNESGHPRELADWLREYNARKTWEAHRPSKQNDRGFGQQHEFKYDEKGRQN